ncbi:PREDICTED: DNA-directed RNA polymerase I subunit 2 isoform X1 [Camelina sativa]|uniref:DNA-directed RNA polymerase subunit beta n=1 Tax=Camelina sativa TaxID=90675 RepID=A0ABM0VT82_CAMSA|nr:PREDICTED: DNA-directed RNA polymerase I subunit 2 isoform X1 [Camelina sativa]
MVVNAKDSTVPNVEDFRELHNLVTHHIESFDYMTDKGLDVMFNRIKPVTVYDSDSDNNLSIWLENPVVFAPQKESSSSTSRKESLFPFEARQAKISYTGTFMADVCFKYNDEVVVRDKFDFGQFPIMLMSKLCSLRGADCRKLLKCKESTSEMGGYFVLNGIERVFRCVIAPKRNHPTSMIRNSFRDRREGYSDKAVAIRCVRDDQSSVTVKLYYLRNGSARVGFWIGGREYLLPVGLVLKALIETNDEEIYKCLNCCYNENYGRGDGAIGTQLVRERAKIILDEVRDLGLFTREQCRKHLGEHFQPVLDGLEKEKYPTVAEAVLRDFIFVHLDNDDDKFNLLIFIIQKLYSLVDQTSLPDNPDSLQNQEILVPGHLITIYLKEKLEDWLRKCKSLLKDELHNKSSKSKFSFESLADVKKVINKNPPRSIGTSIETLLKTGRMNTQSGLDLQQRAGYTVQAERLNFLRFLSFFRAVHRGASFAGLRTTTVRKLLPESWGFLCPVHTPDGEPCGLLNHMTRISRITSQFDSKGNIRDFLKIRKSVVEVLVGVGMVPSLPKLVRAAPPEVIHVLLDGQVVGTLSSNVVTDVVSYLRRLKVEAPSVIPEDLEVGYVPTSMGGSYPGLYLASCPARFIRPVKNISIPSENIELIGPFEQVYMEISCPDGGNGGRNNSCSATHEEIHPTGMISVVANLTPWSDHNQSPRNMYQCQMAKQTMAYSTQALQFRADQKIYHLQTPQSPVVRTKTYTTYSIDENPTGTNAIVAVLAHTGFDMEDAMILNKSSVERGMCHGQIYQTETIDLSDQNSRYDSGHKSFRRSHADKSVHSSIDADGLPYVGQKIYPDEPYYSVYDEVTSRIRTTRRKGTDPVIVDFVSVDMKSKKHPQKANIRFRHARNPIIGDKFSSRHGQKGVCSQLWPDVDMPFNGVTGMRPDLIINPHAFPSRMTIAMLLESIAAKGGSLHGKFVDATPFRNAMKKTNGDKESKSSLLVDDLGSMLTEKGFNFYGTEKLYSGLLGVELECDIFMGPVYYQRLRHMVSDKFQVRSTGQVDQLTHQPIKGRKRGGGIRFGEMERDSLLAHGASYLLHDRLHTSSDHHIADVCSLCGSLLTSSIVNVQQKKLIQVAGKLPPGRTPKKVTCHSCKTSKGMETVAMPYVFRYLAAELASMNIKMTLQLSEREGATDEDLIPEEEK